jgi:predicted ATPase
VRFLVTSRESLGLPGEITVNLDSLPLEEAAELFEARARATGAVLGGNDADRSTLAKLMSRLDGLPLAIELAAARSRLMSPRQLLARMNERFTVLESRGGRMSRQATMRTVIDASWDAMTKAEQAALAQLSVFEGGFSLAAAEAVLDVGSSGVWAPGLVQALIDKSLLRGSDSGRFSMLSIIQDYADERLHAFPRIAAAATRRHWSFFGTFDEAAATADHCIELQNLVAACRRAAAATQPDAAADCLLPAWAALRRVGPLGVATALANEVTAVASASASAKVIAAWVAAAARLAAGEYALARPMIEEGLRIPQAGLAPALEARLRCTAGELETVAGDHGRALGHLEAALRAAHSSAIPTLQCQVLNALGVLEADRGLLDAARANYDCALALARQAHDLHWQGGVLGNIAVLEYSRGNLKDAASALIDALRMAEASSDLRWEGNARCNLGLIHLEQGEVDEALCQFARASEISRDVGNRSLATMVRCNMGLAHEAAGDLDAACRAHADAVAGAHDAGDSRSEAQFSVYLGSALCRFGRLRESAEVLSRAQLLVSDNGDPLMRALVCISLGELALHADGAAQARAHLDEARRLATEMGVDASSELARRLLSVESFIPD